MNVAGEAALTPASRPAQAVASTGAPPRVEYAWKKSAPRTAGLRRRAKAFAIDSVAISLIAWAFTFTTASLGILRIPDIEIQGQNAAVLGLILIVSVFELPIALAYFALCEWLGGRTPGKMVVGLRVRRVDGGRVRLFDAFMRNLLRLLWVTPVGPAFILLDLWSLRATEIDQRLGDLAAETLVLDERVAV